MENVAMVVVCRVHRQQPDKKNAASRCDRQRALRRRHVQKDFT